MLVQGSLTASIQKCFGVRMNVSICICFPFLTLIIRFTESTIRGSGDGDDNSTEASLIVLSRIVIFSFYSVSFAHFGSIRDAHNFHAKVNASLYAFRI